jgi:uncharacterized repeat protein (TIGR03803 family)
MNTPNQEWAHFDIPTVAAGILPAPATAGPARPARRPKCMILQALSHAARDGSLHSSDSGGKMPALYVRPEARRSVSVAMCVKGLMIVAWLAAWFMFTQPARAAERQTLRGHVPPAVSRLTALDRLDPSNRLDLAIALPLRNRESLTNLIREICDPASPNYRRYLTPDQFAKRFGPTDADYQAILAFAETNGFTIAGTHPNRTLLDVNGSVADIERAFRINLRVYQHPTEPRRCFAPAAEPSLDLKVPVLAINGLDDLSPPRPMRRMTFSDERADAITWETGTGPRGTFFAQDFRAAYAPEVSLNGSGESVGLLAFDGFYPGDVAEYKRLAGLPDVPVTNVLVGGATGRPGSQNIEVALDVEMAISMAPGLSSVIIYTGRASTPNTVLNRMATDNLARQLSSSWGFGLQVDPVRQQIFQQYAAQGQSFFQASGDWGAWSGPAFPPSDDPFATVVGGTSLTMSSPGGGWLSETTWFGTGGGISTSYAIPDWQLDVNMSANQGSTTMRNMPDVACVSEGIWVVVNNGEQGTIGGTSAAAPLWAGFTALINQRAAANGQPGVGLVNPALYAIGKGPGQASAFHDITTGNNTNSDSPDRFFAVAGYDLCTGWGTPAGDSTIAALLAPPLPVGIIPETDFIVSGPVGGPFNPALPVFSLTNQTTVTLDWALTNTGPWLDVAPAGGALAPGGPADTVTVGFNASAAFLPAGSYTATIWFTNSNSQSGQARRILLDIVTPPMIVSPPASVALLEGDTASFTVGLSNNASVSYQWQFDNGTYTTNLTDGGDISGVAADTLTVSNASVASAGAYSVIVSNAAGVAISSNAFLAIIPSSPIITLHPTNRTALPGETVTLHAAALGSRPLPCRWVKNWAFLDDGGNVSGARTPHLTLSNVTAADEGTYLLMVGNPLGVVATSNAVLTVVPVTAPGIVMTTLHSFAGGSDGSYPNGLVQSTDGGFHGTTQRGGTNEAGTVFRLATNGTLANLYAFGGGADGANPQAALAQGADGALYGTTFQGGLYDNGSVFRVDTSGGLTTLASFNVTNGAMPYAGLTLSAGGDFYGTTYKNGPNINGTVFRITTNGALAILHSFGTTNGSFPYAGLTRAGNGDFYGTTFKGGTHGYGTVFRISGEGTFASVFSFNLMNGSFPYAGLAPGDDGHLYGATYEGGANGYGVIFRISPEGALTNLYSFGGGSDGANPRARLLLANDGHFYGTTTSAGAYGKGTVFRMTPEGVLTTLATFEGYNGANPMAALVEDAEGNFYGTTQNGGAHDRGTVFRLGLIPAAPQITSQPVGRAVFAGADVRFSVAVIGSAPLYYQWRKDGINLSDGGGLSGSTSRVLALNNVVLADAGTYSVTVSNAFGAVVSADAILAVTSSPPIIVLQPTNQTLAPGATAVFTVTAAGNLPLSCQWRKNDTNLADGGNISGAATASLSLSTVTEANNGIYSVIVSNALGSATSTGAVLTVIPPSTAGTRLATLHWFDGGSDGGTPNGLISSTNGLLYGTAQLGGATVHGTVFEMTTNGVLTTLASFRGTNGSRPMAALTQGADGNFYGTTRYGGTNVAGNVFKMSPVGVIENLYSFTGESDGAYPYTALVQDADASLIGAAENIWAVNSGTLFRITPGGAFTNLYSFTGGLDGGMPTGALLRTADGTLYGMTSTGGVGTNGSVFRLTPGGVLTTTYSFTGGTDGYDPVGALALGADGNFYGVTRHNRISVFEFYGTIFKVTPAGQITTLYALNNTDGAYPYAGLIEGSDGNFYGTTYTGAYNLNGIIFRITPAGSFTTLAVLDGFNTGAHPAAALVEGADGSLYGTTTSDGPGGCGTVFRLSFTSAPQITMQPGNQTVLLGRDTVLNVAVAGAPPLSYQWRKDGTNLTDGGNVFGATHRALNLTNVNFDNSGTYSVVVSNALGSVTSSSAVLSVVVQPVFQSALLTNGTVRLTWSAMTGKQYRLQYRTNLTAGAWLNSGGIITATNTSVTASEAMGSNLRRFYRAVLLP